MTPRETKSPIRMKPLRQAGQSLNERMDHLLNVKAAPWIAAAVFAVVLAGLEWWRWWKKSPPAPIPATVLAVVFAGLACWRVLRILRQVRDLNQGLKGEKAVGECLERLRADGYEVFHDIPGDGFNVDHALVGPGGVFAIETKTRTKPAKGESEVVFDGQKVTVNGFEPERDPVVQVRAVARHVHDIIRQTTGRDLYVRPVLLFPGWYITPTGQANSSDIWVLNGTAFPKWIRNEKESLDADAVQQVAAGIAMYVRNAPQTT